MRFTKLALIALLGGALTMLGCGDDSSGGGNTAGSAGGSGGSAGGAGGGGGTAGMGEVGAVYQLDCSLMGIPVPITSTLNATGDDFTSGGDSDITTQIDVEIAPAILMALPGIAPDAMVDSADVTVTVTGGTPAEISNPVPGLPAAPVPDYSTDPVTTTVTHDGAASEVSLAITGFEAVVSGIPEAIVPGGILTLNEELAACRDFSSATCTGGDNDGMPCDGNDDDPCPGDGSCDGSTSTLQLVAGGADPVFAVN